MKYYKTVGASFACHNEWMSYLDYNAYLIDTKVNRIIKIDKTDTQGLYVVTLENGDRVELPAMSGIDFYELEAGEMPRLFSAETLKNEYHESFNHHLIRLALRADIIETLRTTRKAEPEVYKVLAVLAHEHGADAMRQGIRLYCELKGIK